jgi:hypothetical protein
MHPAAAASLGWPSLPAAPDGIIGGVIDADPEEAAVETHEPKDERIVLEENDPPPDLSREDAAFNRERARLFRDHPGKVALIRFDDVVGVFKDANDAIIEGYRLFGEKRWVVYLITERDETEYIANVDTNHPSFKPLD